ncbi:phage tail tape measure protein [Microbacterium sp. 179-B 1A2 NHS]|uniref:phage tail tape measure protein n=1 Tax=Microbacterium sp. 179-B 1A2 NHS TaxID=3142383 RepID=UPI0039A12B4A
MSDRVVRVKLSAQVQDYQANMLKAAQATRSVGTEAEKLTQQRQAFDLLGRSMLATGGAMAAGVGLAVKRFADFDAALSNVAATGQDAKNNLDALRRAAIDAGASTVFSATESANAIEELAKAGLSASDILSGGLAGSLDLAAAGSLGVAEAAEIAATTLQQFGLDGSEASHVADLLAAGAGKAMGDVADMGQALNQAGLVANQFGVSIEESVGVLSAFASAGMLGSDAGTSMRTMLLRLANPTKEVTALMEELGINAYDSSGQFVGLAGLAGELETSLAGMSEQQKQTTLAMIFGQDAIRGATILLDEGAAGIQKWTDKVDEQGYAADTARTKLDNLKGDVEALGGAFDSALIAMGSGADGPLRALVQSITEVVDGFNDLPDWAQQAALGVGAVGAAAGLAGGAFFLAVPKVAEFQAAMDGFGPTAQRAGRALGTVAGAVGVFAAVGAAVAGLEAVGDALRGIEAESSELANTLTKGSLDKALAQSVEGTAFPWEIENVKANIKDLSEVLDQMREGRPSANSNDPIDLWFDQLSASVTNLGDALAKASPDELAATLTALQDTYGLTDDNILTLIDSSSTLRANLVAQADAAGLAADDQVLLQFALGGSKDATTDAAAATEVLAAEADAAAADLDSLVAALDGVAGGAMGMADAIDGAQGAINTLKDAAENQKASLNGTNDESIRLRDSMREVESAHRDAAQAILENGGSVDEATSKWQAGREAIVQQRIAMGESEGAARRWADQQLGSADQVRGALADVKSAVDALPENMTMSLTANVASAVNTLQGFINRYGKLQGTINYRATQSVETGAERPGRATGGPIFGPGTGTSDSIPAMLSNGEHVITAAEVERAGGHDRIYAWRKAMMTGTLPTFASGGKVSYAIDRSQVVQWNRDVRRGEARADGLGGNALSLVDKLFDIAADIGGKYGKRLRDDALKSEKAFTRLEKRADEAAARLDKAKDKLSDLRDAASSMASRVASAVRSFFNAGDLATSKTVTTGSSSTKVVNGIVVAGAGVTTTQQDTTSAKSIASTMKKDASAIKRFAEKLKRLSKKGLNPALLEEVALLGIEQGEPIVDALLEASKAEIKSINSSYGTINKYSNQSGDTVADANFEKLIDSAEKQVREAKKNSDAIRDQLKRETTKIIKGITDALNKGSNTKVQKKAFGGPIYGPGSSTSDSIPALLSNGENVWSAAQVERAGGQAAVESLKRLQPTLPRFVNGGPVGFGAAAAGPVTSVVTVESARLIASMTAAAVRDVRSADRSADAQDAHLAAMRGVR